MVMPVAHNYEYPKKLRSGFIGCGGLGKRVGGSAYRRLGSKTAFRQGWNDQEVSTKLTKLCKRRFAEEFLELSVLWDAGGRGVECTERKGG